MSRRKKIEWIKTAVMIVEIALVAFDTWLFGQAYKHDNIPDMIFWGILLILLLN